MCVVYVWCVCMVYVCVVCVHLVYVCVWCGVVCVSSQGLTIVYYYSHFRKRKLSLALRTKT